MPPDQPIPEPASRFNLTAEELNRYDWQEIIAAHTVRKCNSYLEVLGANAKKFRESGDEVGERVFAFLHVIASFHPNYDSKGNPYGPLWREADGSRALSADDLVDADIAVLQNIVGEIKDAEFRARVADILWCTKHDYKAAQIAIAAFLEAADEHKEADLWPSYFKRLERAAQLSAKIGFGKALHNDVMARVEARILELREDTATGLLSERLISLALYYEKGDPALYAQIAESFAIKFTAAGDFNFAQRYWRLAARCHHELKDATEVKRCRIAEGEVLVFRADAGLNGKPDAAYASHWLGQALQVLRQAGADPERKKEIHRRMLEKQAEAVSRPGTPRPNADDIKGIPEAREEMQKAAAELVSGKDASSAIEMLAMMLLPTDIKTLRKQVEANLEGFVWPHIITQIATDSSGKSAEFLHPQTGEEEAKRVERQRMVQFANEFKWNVDVEWRIEPARMAIAAEHSVRLRDLYFLVVNNPIVPRGHEGLVLRGLQEGFLGDWPVAMHLLIPQLEAIIRHILQGEGVVTSTFDDDKTQKEKDINVLLRLPETEEILGEDMVFDFQGILIERFGGNMRNESAHGLMHEGAFYHPNAVYLWWLTMHLLWRGYRITRPDPGTNGATGEEP